jgi:hypothetical protein
MKTLDKMMLDVKKASLMDTEASRDNRKEEEIDQNKDGEQAEKVSSFFLYLTATEADLEGR